MRKPVPKSERDRETDKIKKEIFKRLRSPTSKIDHAILAEEAQRCLDRIDVEGMNYEKKLFDRRQPPGRGLLPRPE